MTSPTSLLVTVAPVMSDRWLEDMAPSLLSVDTENLVVDFRPAQWVELSALMLLVGTLLTRIRSFGNIEFLFHSPVRTEEAGRAKALRLLLESKFYIALQRAMRPEGRACRILFDISHLSTAERATARRSIEEHIRPARILASLRSPPLTLDGVEVLGIEVATLMSSAGIPIGFLAPLGYRASTPGDFFVAPITYLAREELPAYLERTDSDAGDAKSTLSADIEPGLRRLVENSRLLLEVIYRTWLYELLLNAYDHGGDHTLYCLRMGDWAVREAHRFRQQIADEGYRYRTVFLKDHPEGRLNRFLDAYVLDTGNGFEGLAEAYQAEKKVLAGRHRLKKLHRYALFPHSTRKQPPIDSYDSPPLYATGLGFIGGRISKGEGVLAIKDREALTFFHSRNLDRIKSEGDSDSVSHSKIPLTLVTTIVPAPDDDWTERSNPGRVPTDVAAGAYIYAEAKDSRGVLPNRGLFLESHRSIPRPIELEDAVNNLQDFPTPLTFLLDVSEFRPAGKGSTTRLIQRIRPWRRKGVPVVLAGASIAHVKLLQSYLDVATRRPMRFLAALVITTDLHLFACGSLTDSQRLALTRALEGTGGLVSPTRRLLNEFGVSSLESFSLSGAERALNRARGERFGAAVRQSYLINAPVLDRHGQILDSFHEVKTYLGTAEAEERWSADIVRFIARSRSQIVVVDCPELRKLVVAALRRSLQPQPPIYRLHGETLEVASPHSLRGKGPVLFLVSSVYTGSILSVIDRLIVDLELTYPSVLCLMDLSGRSKIEVQETHKFFYDRFSRGSPPRLLDSGEVSPEYVVSQAGRSVPAAALQKEEAIRFESAVPYYATHQQIRHAPNVRIGHVAEHGHHYDVFLDVRRSIADGDQLSLTLQSLVIQQVRQRNAAIVYAEESELNPILSSLRLGPGNVPIDINVARHVVDDSYVWRPPSSPDLASRHVVILDEGIYSGGTIIGLLNLVRKSGPTSIDVIVLEKRLSVRARINELTTIVQGETPIRFLAVLDVRSPCWQIEDCPYCAASIPLFSRKVRDLVTPFSSTSIEVFEKDSEIMLWFVGGLYESRAAAAHRLRKIAEAAANSRDEVVWAARMTLIHVSVLARWFLLSSVESTVALALSLGTTRERVMLLKTAASAPELDAWSLVRLTVLANIPYMENREVESAVAEVAGKFPHRLDELDHLVAERTWSDPVLARWRAILSVARSRSGEQAHDLRRFLVTTGIFRTDKHEKLSHRMTTDPDGSTSELRSVRQYLLKLGELPEHLRDAARSTQIDELISLLDSPELQAETQKYLCPTIDMVLSALAVAVGTVPPPQHTSSVIEGSVERRLSPLICLPHEAQRRLHEHFASNQRHGRCQLRIVPDVSDQTRIRVLVISEKTISQKRLLQYRVKSPSLFMVRKFLEPVGVTIDYSRLETGQFVAELSLQVVDHVEL